MIALIAAINNKNEAEIDVPIRPPTLCNPGRSCSTNAAVMAIATESATTIVE